MLRLRAGGLANGSIQIYKEVHHTWLTQQKRLKRKSR